MMNISHILPAAVTAVTGIPNDSPLSIPSSDAVVVLLVDGMGFENLLAAQRIGIDTTALVSQKPIQSTFPSTTPVSLASLGTGLTPGMHGFVGATFLVPELDTFLQPLKWDTTPDAFAVQPEPTWFERAEEQGCRVTRIGPGAYADSGLTRAVLRGGRHQSASTLDELVNAVRATLTFPGPQLVYAYYPDLDKTGHIYGAESEEWNSELMRVLEAIHQIASTLTSRQTLVVTADHGMLNIAERRWIEDDSSLMRDVRFITGEPRMRHVFAQEGNAAALHRAWTSLSDIADVYSREEFIASGLLGSFERAFELRIGDVVAVAKDGFALASRTVDERVSNLIGNHGGGTSTERLIPCTVMAG